MSSKEAQAQAVLGQISQIDTGLGQAVEAYNLANVRLGRIEGDLRTNRHELTVARSTTKRSQRALSARLVASYTSSQDNSTLTVLLGASSLQDLLSRVETINSISHQDASIVRQVAAAKAAIARHRLELRSAHSEQQRVVSERAAQRSRIQDQLAQRRQLLSSIRGQIAHLKAVEATRQLQITREAKARLAVQPPQIAAPSTASSPVGVSASTPEGATVAPPAAHGGVVGIAMRYLGVPYVWGGSTPRGFDCSGLVSYVFAQIGVSLPHSTYALYAMGAPVSRDQLQAGDLVFFAGLGHIGIYIGGGQFIHAPHTGDVVKISSMTGWYASTYVGARRMP